MANVLIQLKRGKQETWEKQNPTLAYGEPGYEKETGKLKIGNGITAWNELPYLTNGGGSADVSYFGVPYESAEAVYDISAVQDGGLKMYIFSNSVGKYDAVVRGTGEMCNYTEDSRPYPVEQISRLHIENGVSSIGSYFMYAAYSLKELTFADSTKITHLGAYAFAKTLIDGEYSFTGLTDTTFDNVFHGCAKLEGVTLSATVQTITGTTFQDCLALRYVKGLTGLTSITGQAAFYNCIVLEELGVIPANVSLEKAVFVHCPNTAVISGTETPLYQATWGNIGTDCFIQNMWTAEQLTAIRATTGESYSLPVPLYDSQMEEIYNSLMIWHIGADLKSSKRVPITNLACGYFTLYHIYNSRNPNTQYRSFREFVEGLIYRKKITVTQSLHDILVNDDIGASVIAQNTGVSYEVGQKITAFDLPYILTNWDYSGEGTMFWGFCQSLGWTITKTHTNAFADGKSTAKQTSIDSIKSGKPVYMPIFTRGANSHGGHAIALIGYNAETDKFLIVNSYSDLPAKAYDVVYWNEFETLTTPYPNVQMMTFDFGDE